MSARHRLLLAVLALALAVCGSACASEGAYPRDVSYGEESEEEAMREEQAEQVFRDSNR